MMMKCKHHEAHITFGIEPNGQTQKWSIQVYKLTDRQQPIDQPSLPHESNAEEMKLIINRTRTMQQQNPRRPYEYTVQKKPANME